MPSARVFGPWPEHSNPAASCLQWSCALQAEAVDTFFFFACAHLTRGRCCTSDLIAPRKAACNCLTKADARMSAKADDLPYEPQEGRAVVPCKRPSQPHSDDRQLWVDFGPMLRSKAAIRFAVSTMNCDWPQWPKSRWLLRRLDRRFGTMRWSAYSHACSDGAYGPAQRAT